MYVASDILLTVTVMDLLAILSLFPALFFASQVYSVTFGTSVSARYSGDDCWGIRTLFSYHRIVGAGIPLAMQYRNNLVPTLTVYVGPGGFKLTLGGSVIYNNYSVATLRANTVNIIFTTRLPNTST